MQTLQKGSRGAPVALLQLGLRRAGYGALALDGSFGPSTERALRAFQRSSGLTPDGIFGPGSEKALLPWLRGYALHTVRPGDTLWRLASRYGADLAALEAANPTLDPFDLRLRREVTVG